MPDNEPFTFEDAFEHFCSANSVKSIVSNFKHLCHLSQIDLERYYDERPSHTRLLYNQIQSNQSSWKYKALCGIFDKRANLNAYKRTKSFRDINVLIIGCGPVGLRFAIECAMLGAKCFIVEKRDKYY